MTWQNAGSLAATNGQKDFVGTSTLLTGGYIDDTLVYVNGTVVWMSRVASITDNTHMASADNWPFSTGTIANGTWALMPTSPLRNSTATLNNNIANLISLYSSILALSPSDNYLTLNKAASGNKNGLYLTTASAAVARIGTDGDDNLRIGTAKVGGGYNDAIVIDKSTGLMTVLGDPTAALGVVTKQYADGLSVTKTVRAASLDPITISAPGTSIGGTTPAVGDIELLAGQSTASQNGIWQYNGASVPMTRPPGANSAAGIQPGISVNVSEGTYAGVTFRLVTAGPLVIGSTSLSFIPQDSASGTPEVTVASSGTCDIGAANGDKVAISGTTTITGLGAKPNRLRIVRFTGSLTLTHNATSLMLKGSADRQTAAGDIAIYESDASGNWREIMYAPANGGDIDIPESTVASAATCDIGAANSDKVAISGTTTITSFGTRKNCKRRVRFTGTTLTVTYNATSLITQTGANLQVAAGDILEMESDASGNWRVRNATAAGPTLFSQATAVSVVGGSGASTITSVICGPGTWEFFGTVYFAGSSTANVMAFFSISTITNALDLSAVSRTYSAYCINGANGYGSGFLTDVRTFTVQTQVYLTGRNFSVTDNQSGSLRAKRVF